MQFGFSNLSFTLDAVFKFGFARWRVLGSVGQDVKQATNIRFTINQGSSTIKMERSVGCYPPKLQRDLDSNASRF